MSRNLVVIALLVFITGCAGEQDKTGKFSLECADVYNAGGSVCGGPSEASAGGASLAPLAVIEENRGDVSRSEEVVLYLLFENSTGLPVIRTVEVGLIFGSPACGSDSEGVRGGIWLENAWSFEPGMFDIAVGFTCSGTPLGANSMFLEMDGELHTLVHFNTIE